MLISVAEPIRYTYTKTLKMQFYSVQYCIKICRIFFSFFSVPPQLSVNIDKQLPIKEGTDVSLTCSVTSNPPIAELEWLHDGVSLGPPLRKDTSNRTLNILAAGPEHKGHYQCAAANSEGRSVSEPEILKLTCKFTTVCLFIYVCVTNVKIFLFNALILYG